MTNTTTPLVVDHAAPVVVAPTNEQAPARPPMYAVVLHNDDTTMPWFVVTVLTQAFGLDETSAHQVMMRAHLSGKAPVVITTLDMAETKLVTAQAMVINAPPNARAPGSPGCELQFTLEPETDGD